MKKSEKPGVKTKNKKRRPSPQDQTSREEPNTAGAEVQCDPVNAPYLKGLLRRHGYRLSKGLGQHFLINEPVRDCVAQAAIEDPSETALEIGPGAGVLTVGLAERAHKVITVEVGKHLLPLHAEVFADHRNVHVLYEDFRKITAEELAAIAPGPYAVGANLPYGLTSPILFRFLDGEIPWKRLVVMVQKEVAERLAAAPGSKTYGALSVMAQSAARIEIIREVPPGSFMPPPKVQSAVVRMEPLEEADGAVPAEERVFLRRVVNAVFGARRKTLLNNLTSLIGREQAAAVLAHFDLDPRIRGETLSVAQFIALAEHLKNLLNPRTEAE